MTKTKQEQERRNFVHTVEVLMASALAERDLTRTTGRAFTKEHRIARVALAVAGSAIVIMLCFYAAVQLSLVNWGTVESVATLLRGMKSQDGVRGKAEAKEVAKTEQLRGAEEEQRIAEVRGEAEALHPGGHARRARKLVKTVSVRSEPAGSDTKTVIVAAAPLQFGTVLTANLLAQVQWPASSVPAGTFSSLEAILGGPGARTVLATIGKNEPILASKITGAGQRGTLSSVIEPDMKAITIRIDDVFGVAGFFQPDDRVDVLLTRNDRPTASPYPDVLLQNARVLAIDQIADRSGQAKPAKAVTIEVTTEDAQKVVLGAVVGQLSLALRQAGSLNIAESRRRIGLDDPSKLRREAEAVKTVSPEAVRERGYYELTPTGRREVRADAEIKEVAKTEQLRRAGEEQRIAESKTTKRVAEEDSRAEQKPLELGKTYYSKGEFGLAEKAFRSAVELDKNDPEAWVGLAASYDHLRRFDQALRAYDVLFRLVGRTPTVLNNLGYHYILQGDYTKARETLLEAQRGDPGNKFIRNNIDLIETGGPARQRGAR